MIKRSIFTLVAILATPLLLLAQKPDHERSGTLNTEGTGRISVAPDWITTYLNTSSNGMDYNQVVLALNNKVSKLEKALVMAGFKKDDIKTTSYTVNKNIVWVENRNVDSGYIAQQGFTLEFDNNNQKIASLLKGLSEGKVDASFNFSFGLSTKKEEEVKNELLKKAVQDATSKANVIALASNVKMKKIIRIHYGTPEFQRPMPMTAMALQKSTDFSGFNAQSLEMSDSVTITWELE